MFAWFSRPLSRLRYVAWGLALGALKTGLDYAVAAAYRHPYSLLFYVSPVDAPLFHPSDDRPYWLALATVAMPFIAIGVALTARRLRDAAISPWFALLFFVPFANLLFFMTLTLVPSRPRPMPVDGPRRRRTASRAHLSLRRLRRPSDGTRASWRASSGPSSASAASASRSACSAATAWR